MHTQQALNRRKHDRYVISEIRIEGVGSIVEVSRKGLKVRKAPGFTPTSPALPLKLSTVEIKTEIRWEDATFLGLLFAGSFDDPGFIVKKVLRPKEAVAPPQMKVPDAIILNYKKDEILTKMASLMMEIDSPEPNIRKIVTFIDEISLLEEQKVQAEMKGKDTEAAHEDNPEPRILKDELLAQAIAAGGGEGHGGEDVSFAINRLGYDNTRAILKNYIHNKIFSSETSLAAFRDRDSFNIIKTAVFRNLCQILGLFEIQSEGNALLSCETVGIEIMIRESSGILDSYYTTVSRLYSEASRAYEKSLFGVDPVLINKHYFEQSLGAFGEFYNGYLLAHCALNPHFEPFESLKISFTKNSLLFSHVAYLTFLAVMFILDGDKAAAHALVAQLRGRGMNESKVVQFLDKAVGDAQVVARDFNVKCSIARPKLPTGPSDNEKYFMNDPRFMYLLQSFRSLATLPVKRMALRYEDPVYTRFMLGKIIGAEGLGLHTKPFVVIPCGNVSDSQWYIRDFAWFDTLVFCDIQKLPALHLPSFVKLWNEFEGQVIVTFSKYAFLDYSNPQMHALLAPSLVDFPSYYLHDGIYQNMIEQAVQYLAPGIAEQQIDSDKYRRDVFTMHHVKSDILLNYEIV